MKLTKVKIAIATAILIPSSAFAYRASQPVEPEPVKVVEQEKKEIKVEEPETIPVVVEEAVTEPVETEDAEPVPAPAPVPAENPAPEGWVVGSFPDGVERCRVMHVIVGAFGEERWQNILNGGEITPGVPKAHNTMYRNASNGQYTCFVY